MAKRAVIESAAEELAAEVLAGTDLRIYDMEYVKEGKDYYLRLYIDKDGGVTIEDCETASRAFSDKLDEADMIKDPYILEVSSPGLGRTLKKDRHFEQSIGEEVEVSTFKKLDGRKEFRGNLTAFDKESVTIEEEGSELRILRTDISRIRLAFDF